MRHILNQLNYFSHQQEAAYIASLPCVSAGKLSVICLSILRYTFHFVSAGEERGGIVFIVTKT